MSTSLTETERLKLGDLEIIIEHGLTTFVQVGVALAQIREGRLYRDTHETFEAYCQDKWGWSSSRARQLIASSEVVQQLESVTSGNGPKTERQARELGKLPEDRRAEVWQEAVATAPKGKVSAEHIRETANPKPKSTPISERVKRSRKAKPKKKAEPKASAEDMAASIVASAEAKKPKAERPAPQPQPEPDPTPEPSPEITATLVMMDSPPPAIDPHDLAYSATEKHVEHAREWAQFYQRFLAAYARRKVAVV